MRLPAGTANVSVTWKGVEVATRTVQLTSDTTLTIDARVYYIALNALDSRGKWIEDLHVVLLLGTESIESGITDDKGSLTVRLPGADLVADMRWYGVFVGDQALTADKDKDVNLAPKIYYLDVKLVDSQAKPIEGASVTVSSGDITRGSLSTAGGAIEERLPIGEYNISASWKRASIFTTKVQLSADVNKSYTADVVYLTVEVIDANDSPLTSVYARVESTATVDAGYTMDGKVVFRLPKGSYKLYVRYANTFYLTDIVYEPPPRSIALSNDDKVTIKVDVYPIPVYMTNAFFIGIIVALLVVLLIYILWRHRKKKMEKEQLEGTTAPVVEPQEKSAEGGEKKEEEPVSEEAPKEIEKSEVSTEKDAKGPDNVPTEEAKEGGDEQ